MFLRELMSSLSFLQDRLAERGQDQLGAERGGLVAFVENWIDLRDLERGQLFGIRNHFHCEMRFPVVRAPADGCCDAGRVDGIEKVRIESAGESIGAARHN